MNIENLATRYALATGAAYTVDNLTETVAHTTADFQAMINRLVIIDDPIYGIRHPIHRNKMPKKHAKPPSEPAREYPDALTLLDS